MLCHSHPHLSPLECFGKWILRPKIDKLRWSTFQNILTENKAKIDIQLQRKFDIYHHKTVSEKMTFLFSLISIFKTAAKVNKLVDFIDFTEKWRGLFSPCHNRLILFQFVFRKRILDGI